MKSKFHNELLPGDNMVPSTTASIYGYFSEIEPEELFPSIMFDFFPSELVMCKGRSRDPMLEDFLDANLGGHFSLQTLDNFLPRAGKSENYKFMRC